jgi:hypothetical protein
VRLLRLRLRNYRGIDAAEIRFERNGVTIVEGRNEAGKSSLAEAIGILFDHLDSTKKAAVLEIKPVHRDEGAEIEAEVECGPHLFTYSKRFHKRPETRLRIDRPRPESLTGREAHERAGAILEETIDVALWRALRIEQGTEIAGPALAGQTRLSAALDAAGGSARAGEREESLFDAVRTEFERHFTPTGQEGKELRERQEALVQQREARDRSRKQLESLDQDIVRSEQLRREVKGLEDAERTLALAARKHDAALESLRHLEAEVATRRAERAAAEAESRAAVDAVERRSALAAELTARNQALGELAEEMKLADPARAAAAKELVAVEQSEAQARAGASAASALLELRRKDREHRHDELDLEQLRERAARVALAKEAIRTAELTLAGPAIGDGDVAALEAAQRELDDARARLTVGSPQVTLIARAAIEPRVDGKAAPLRAGETIERAAERSLSIELPGVAELRIVAGSGAAELRANLEQARAALAQRLAAAQVEDLAAARRTRDACNEARRVAKEQRKLLADNLRDLTEEQLRAKVESVRARVGDYAARRGAEPPLPADLAAAKRAEGESEQEVKRLASVLAEATRRLEQARGRAREHDIAGAKAQSRVEHAKQSIREAEERIGRARVEADDAALAERRRNAEERLRRKTLAAEDADGRLAAAAPEAARALADNARRSAEDASRRLAESRRERDDLRVRLELLGEEGLAERLDAAAAACSRLEVELSRARSRAAAAKLLHDTLAAAKKEAQAAYVAPLAAQVERLGRLVFGSTLRIELDPTLAIASRTLDGVTVPFRSLSGGAREQLSLLMRLACAILIAKDGGAPLVIDDALGYSDPDRLETMGAALALAGESCQVIVLTCMPERYRTVGGAKRVRMEAARG